MRAGPTAPGSRSRPGVVPTIVVGSRPASPASDEGRAEPSLSNRTPTVIELTERRSAPLRTAVAIVVLFCGFALLSTLRFPRPVLWPILGAVAIYLLLFLTLSVAFLTRPRTRERIEIDGSRLTIELSSGRSLVRREWRTPWTVLDAYDDEEDDVRLWLVSGDQRVAIGRHVGAQARRDAITSLQACLPGGV
ncbi:MAG TPA: DUF2244 domain-containing protein [Caulobacter sp.]|jgi:uncharacterized membrane protein|nr:DUF2244 domain-containing protein [Caulobacter sp.]